MRIDAHLHFWRIGANDCTWPTPDLGAIHRDFLPEHIVPLARPLGVTGAVLVQSQESDRDTDFLCECAAREDFIKAVVAWADLKAPDAPARLRALAARPKVRGVRPMLQSLPPDWITDRALDPAVAALLDLGLRFDALVLPQHLPALLSFAKRHPALPIVIDHAAKPRIRERLMSPWADDIAALAALANVHCKLSGLLTEARPGDGDAELGPYAAHLHAHFGRERLMWGSDWPVLNLAADYASWFAQAARLAGAASEDARTALYAANARRFYAIGAPHG